MHMKLLGIDYGKRRIGLAVTDPTGTCIRSLGVIDKKTDGDVKKAVIRVIAEQKPDKVVFGVPLDINDRESKQSRRIRYFAGSIAADASIAIDFTDESYSSRHAEALLKHRKKKRREDKAATDTVAACLILEQYQRENGCEYD